MTLRQLREEAVMTRDELAKACEVSVTSLYKWEVQGRMSTPKHIRKLAEVLGKTPQEIRAAILSQQQQ